ncbi:glutathione S-transferase family protein [Phenylobacterium deserti]|uniref:Glutathione S-transferase n=1 Tax=Phenylobacterium deserti TaxID=1914756 RepID=A0A328AT51_9CAUL|nr:glutathione S-transferase family protein [Phenylobacterium deserti]RAK58302.1 glutathione S-transferase [Phenylobacterium deserti]
MLRILGRLSSINVRKVMWTAAETGLAFEHEGAWAGERSSRDPEFLALNPNGLVPVLVTDQGPLWESNAICRYLAGRAGRDDLYPADPWARAQVDMWLDWQATELNTAWRPAALALLRGDQSFDAAAIQASADKWTRLMGLLETQLARTGAFVTGAQFTLADIALSLSLQRWLLTPIPHPDTPALLAWRQRLQARPAAQAWIDPLTP